MDFFYIFITLALVTSTFVLGAILILRPIPRKLFLNSYRSSSRLLGILYMVFAIITAYILFIGIDNYQPEYFRFSATFISCTQALIFTFALLSLLNPHFSKRQTIMFITHASVIFLFLLTYHVFTEIDHDPLLISVSGLAQNIFEPVAVLRILFTIFYLYQFLHYSLEISRSIRKYNESINNYFSETGNIKLHWVKVAFVSAVTIGLVALVFQTMPGKQFDIVFSILLIIFFVVFAINFINFKRIFHIIEPALEQGLQAEEEPKLFQKKSGWDFYKKNILDRKLYLIEGITLVEMAENLKIGRTTLSNLINTEEKQNFNHWVNSLRISEAKELMLRNQDFSLSDIAFKTGFSEQSNFCREFKLKTGKTPSAWKKSNISSN